MTGVAREPTGLYPGEDAAATSFERGDDPITPAQPDVDTGQSVAGQVAGITDQRGHNGAPRKIAAMP